MPAGAVSLSLSALNRPHVASRENAKKQSSTCHARFLVSIGLHRTEDTQCKRAHWIGC